MSEILLRMYMAVPDRNQSCFITCLVYIAKFEVLLLTLEVLLLTVEVLLLTLEVLSLNFC